MFALIEEQVKQSVAEVTYNQEIAASFRSKRNLLSVTQPVKRRE
jgi:hypothetical protein